MRMKNLNQCPKLPSANTIRKVTGVMFILFSLFAGTTVVAQTYESENLRKQEEEHVAAKNKKLGLKPNSDSNIAQNLNSTSELPIQNTIQESTNISIGGDYFKLLDINAINFDSNLDKSSIERIQNEVKSELNLLEGWFSPEKSSIVFKNKESGLVNKLEYNKVNNKLLSTCNTCDLQSFEIEENTSKKITLVTKSQDEKEVYFIRYTFVK